MSPNQENLSNNLKFAMDNMKKHQGNYSTLTRQELTAGLDAESAMDFGSLSFGGKCTVSRSTARTDSSLNCLLHLTIPSLFFSPLERTHIQNPVHSNGAFLSEVQGSLQQGAAGKALTTQCATTARSGPRGTAPVPGLTSGVRSGGFFLSACRAPGSTGEFMSAAPRSPACV